MLKHLFTLLIYLKYCDNTVDVTLPELQYLADHLQHEECRRLLAALHFKTYEKPNALDQAELKVSKDISCLRLLLHWNSEKKEGLGQTHEVIGHRLRQIGRTDLADWLGKAVFHELGKEMERDLNEPFPNTLNTTEENLQKLAKANVGFQSTNLSEWIAFDTICWALLLVLIITTFGVLAKVLCMLRVKRTKKRTFFKTEYDQVETESNSGYESEDRFDIRNPRASINIRQASLK